ncbi:hypothetical protein ACGFYY_34890 [Streptomyces sp. NPDC048331]|uniref:hypothetical protein n=1 Tax=Streptomyces sp. NPDC048331 TaxID=3365534 RepID=UPI00372168D3
MDIANSGTERPATYVHHCHLLKHEDDDLMRAFTIIDADTPLPVDHGGGHGHRPHRSRPPLPDRPPRPPYWG